MLLFQICIAISGVGFGPRTRQVYGMKSFERDIYGLFRQFPGSAAVLKLHIACPLWQVRVKFRGVPEFTQIFKVK